jgi:transcriptional regulator with XRE-family HTH domain
VTTSERFGKNLKRLRKDLGISQEELGFRSGLHRTEISMVERAVRKPSFETTVKLSIGLEAPVADLFSGITWEGGPAAPSPSRPSAA